MPQKRKVVATTKESPEKKPNSTVSAELPRTMRAIRVHKFGGPNVLKLEADVPVPSVAGKEVRKSIGRFSNLP